MLILDETEPFFERYVAEEDPEFEEWRSWDTQTLLGRICADRHKIFTQIACLPENTLEKTGIHKKYGRLNVLQWTEFFLLHEAHHIFTIFQLANDTEKSTV